MERFNQTAGTHTWNRHIHKICFNRRRVLFHNILYSKQTGETKSRIGGRCLKIGLIAIFHSFLRPTRKQVLGFQSSGKLQGWAGVETNPLPLPPVRLGETPGGKQRHHQGYASFLTGGQRDRPARLPPFPTPPPPALPSSHRGGSGIGTRPRSPPGFVATEVSSEPDAQKTELKENTNRGTSSLQAGGVPWPSVPPPPPAPGRHAVWIPVPRAGTGTGGRGRKAGGGGGEEEEEGRRRRRGGGVSPPPRSARVRCRSQLPGGGAGSALSPGRHRGAAEPGETKPAAGTGRRSAAGEGGGGRWVCVGGEGGPRRPLPPSAEAAKPLTTTTPPPPHHRSPQRAGPPRQGFPPPPPPRSTIPVPPGWSPRPPLTCPPRRAPRAALGSGRRGRALLPLASNSLQGYGHYGAWRRVSRQLLLPSPPHVTARPRPLPLGGGWERGRGPLSSPPAVGGSAVSRWRGGRRRG